MVGVAGVIGSYGEYSIQTTEHQVVAHLCVCHHPQGLGGPLARGAVTWSCQEHGGGGVAPILLSFMLCFCFPNCDYNTAATAIVTTATATSCAEPPQSCLQASRSWRDFQGPPGDSPGSLPAEQHEGSGFTLLSPLLHPGLGKTPPAQGCPCIPKHVPLGGSHGCCWG